MNQVTQSTKSIEPLLDPNNEQYTVYPIKYKNIWDMYKKQQSCYWKAEEIDFSTDYDDYLTLNKDEQHFVKMILAFFAASDGIINANLAEKFLTEVTVMEVKIVYGFQMMMENIHGEVYSLMLDNIVKNSKEQLYLFNAIETVPAVKKMADWAFKWSNSESSFAHRVIAFAIIEGVFFSGVFAAIYWLKKYKNNGTNFMKGLTSSNEFISRDEGLHCDTACMIYNELQHKLSEEEVYMIMEDGVKISQQFMNDAIPCRLINMNKESMSDYIEYIGDRLLVALGYHKKYKKPNPFKFMETIGLPGKTNFFERRASEYQDAHIQNKPKSNKTNMFASSNF